MQYINCHSIVGPTIAAKFTIKIVSIVYILYIFNQLIKQFMLIPVIIPFSNFNELFLYIYL